MSYTYKNILPEEIFVSIRLTTKPDPNIVERNLTGNSFMDLFARLIHERGHLNAPEAGQIMGIDGHALAQAVYAMSGINYYEWRDRYLLLMTDYLLTHYDKYIIHIYKRLGFKTRSTLYRFCERMKRPTPRQIQKKRRK